MFAVGNAAGEAHPVVAEGISMAMQGAWLLARRLIEWRVHDGAHAGLSTTAIRYRSDWRRAFVSRLYASAALAHWAMRPQAVLGVMPVIRCCPQVLTWGARWSGKVTSVCSF
jgi:2-polyprenyl-6-methoxyphenol hydroxylase-like FAD-dependent oxidoreductase